MINGDRQAGLEISLREKWAFELLKSRCYSRADSHCGSAQSQAEDAVELADALLEALNKPR